MQDRTIPFALPLRCGKKVVAAFDMAGLTSDAGLAFARSADDRLGLTASLASLLADPRDPRYVTHSALDLLRQRVYGIIAGYADINDAQHLRGAPALKLAVGRDVLDRDKDLGSPATLCRFEHWATPQSLALSEMTLFENWRDKRVAPKSLTLDADSTWNQTHGAQQLSFFNGHYGSYGYHPILVFDAETEDLIVAHLRPGNVGAAEGIVAWLEGLVEGIRAKWPGVKILFRADAGFATPDVYAWCEAHDVEYLIGLGTNKRLAILSASCLEAARAEYLTGRVPPGEQAKVFTEFEYKAGSWKRHRRVVAKAEYGALGANQRYVVTSLKGRSPRRLYAEYGMRGESENWIKNFKNGLAADRLSCSGFLPNAFRLLLHQVAYRICLVLRKAAESLTGERWQFDTLRLRLIKVAALMVEQARRIVMHMPAAYPYATLWGKMWTALSPPMAR